MAADGKTARGSFITPGVIHSRLTEEHQKYCMILWERYGSDFICEDGEWKYLHEHVCPDIPGTLDCTNWAAAEYARLTQPDEEGIQPQGGSGGCRPPSPIPAPARPYSLLHKPANTVPWPSPMKPWTSTIPTLRPGKITAKNTRGAAALLPVF